MHRVTLDEACTDLSKLVACAVGGETILITEGGQPMAEIGPAQATPPESERGRLGFMAGQITVPDDFDRLGDAEIANLFGSSA